MIVSLETSSLSLSNDLKYGFGPVLRTVLSLCLDATDHPEGHMLSTGKFMCVFDTYCEQCTEGEKRRETHSGNWA